MIPTGRGPTPGTRPPPRQTARSPRVARSPTPPRAPSPRPPGRTAPGPSSSGVSACSGDRFAERRPGFRRRRACPQPRHAIEVRIGLGERGEALRDARERRLFRRASGRPTLRRRLRRTLFGLDRLPVRQHLVGPTHRHFTVHVRVPPDQLLHDVPHDVREAVIAVLSRDLRLERDLQQQVALFLEHLPRVGLVQRVEQLVRLLEQERAQLVPRQLAVPRAAVGRAQPRRNVLQGRV